MRKISNVGSEGVMKNTLLIVIAGQDGSYLAENG